MRKFSLLLLVCLLSLMSFAQLTTSALEGLISGQDGAAIPGASIVITHVPTGTRSGTQADAGGKFLLNNLKPGGPYAVRVSAVGFAPQGKQDLYLTLGKVARQTFTLLEAATTLGKVAVTGNRSDPFTADKNGQAYFISQQAIQNLPTLNRSLSDLTKLMPQGNKNSFGGSNYRFNNLSIDGMATNDVLGFQEPASGAAGTVASGTPGALAGTQPISIDAIDEISVVISPFNVTLGNFTGANINAVTKTGTQRLEVSFDFINLGNLLNRDWSRQYFVPNINNSGYALLDFVRIENQRPVYQFKNPTGSPWQTDPINSRWQGQLGLRYAFN